MRSEQRIVRVNTRLFLYRVDPPLFVCFGNHIRLLLVYKRMIIIKFVELRVIVTVSVVVVDTLFFNYVVYIYQFMFGVIRLQREHPVRAPENVVFDVEEGLYVEEGLKFFIVEHTDNRDTHKETHKSIHLNYMYKKLKNSLFVTEYTASEMNIRTMWKKYAAELYERVRVESDYVFERFLPTLFCIITTVYCEKNIRTKMVTLSDSRCYVGSRNHKFI